MKLNKKSTLNYYDPDVYEGIPMAQWLEHCDSDLYRSDLGSIPILNSDIGIGIYLEMELMNLELIMSIKIIYNWTFP